jgi:hypothetical protein
LLEKYFRLAMDGDGTNINPGLLYHKLATRKASLLGLDAPSHATALIIHATAQERQESSTDAIEKVLSDLRNRRLTEGCGDGATHPAPDASVVAGLVPSDTRCRNDR